MKYIWSLHFGFVFLFVLVWCFVLFCFSVLGIELRASCVLGKYSTAEPHSQPFGLLKLETGSYKDAQGGLTP